MSFDLDQLGMQAFGEGLDDEIEKNFLQSIVLLTFAYACKQTSTAPISVLERIEAKLLAKYEQGIEELGSSDLALLDLDSDRILEQIKEKLRKRKEIYQQATEAVLERMNNGGDRA